VPLDTILGNQSHVHGSTIAADGQWGNQRPNWSRHSRPNGKLPIRQRPAKLGDRCADLGVDRPFAATASAVTMDGRREDPVRSERERFMTTMTITDNKQLAVEWLELVSTGDVEEMCHRTSPAWTMEGGPPALPAGHEGVRALFASFGSIEQEWSIEDVIGEGDKVVIRATNRCVQDSFFGVPARGIEQAFTATFILQITDGLVVRTWRNAADLQRLLQLGARVLPPATPRPSIP
jgi:hypothetical protein